MTTATTGNSSSSSNTFRFLLTTDNHLGFQEKDPRRCHDSFITFEECLRAAVVTHDTDAILLSGDLFHDNKPSLNVMHRTIGLLRRYVMGNKPISFSMLSDPATNFPEHPVPCANFQDPNLNIAMPIFTIHGNHDDPLGENSPSPVDVLASAGLVNHFGHCPSVEMIVVRPVLLQKGNTFVALYGLGAIGDNRLHRCFERKQVQFLKPRDPPAVAGAKWVNILLFHQNRVFRPGHTKGYIPESMLRDYGFDLVIWGNEHEQLMAPQPAMDGAGFEIVQPGSTIMTSLSAGESNPKQYGILEIRGGQYRVTPYPLTGLRPVVRRQVELWHDQPGACSLDAVEAYLHSVVKEMYHEADQQIAQIPDDVMESHPDIKFPLMRLSVDFTSHNGGADYPKPNANRFGLKYVDTVANAQDILKPMKPKPQRLAIAHAARQGGNDVVVPVAPQMSTVDIRAKIASVFNANARDACSFLSEAEVAAAVYKFADKGSKDAIKDIIEKLIGEGNGSIWKTLRKAHENLAELKEDKVQALALNYKLETTKAYVRNHGDDEALPNISVNGDATATGAVAPDNNGLSSHPLGALLPKATDSCGGVEAPPPIDMLDGDGDEYAAEFDRCLPAAIKATIDHARGLHVDVDDHNVGNAPFTSVIDVDEDTVTKKDKPKRATKRGREDDNPAPAKSRGKQSIAAPIAAPKLLLTKDPVMASHPVAPPPPAPTTNQRPNVAPGAGGAKPNILPMWTH